MLEATNLPNSYGVLSATVEFLTALETSKLQQLSSWYYHTNMPRLSVTTYPLSKLPIYAQVYFIEGEKGRIKSLHRFNPLNKQFDSCLLNPEVLTVLYDESDSFA